MVPRFAEGDRVLTFNWTFPLRGEVVVFRERDKFLIKRITKTVEGLFYVKGDNLKRSKNVWTISREQIVGKVVLKY